MQRRTVLVSSFLATSLCLVVPSSASQPDRWVTFKTGESEFGPDEHQIDRTTIRREGPYVVFWTRIWVLPLQQALVFSQDERLAFWSQKFAVDCAHHKYGPKFIDSTDPPEKKDSASLQTMPWDSLDKAPVIARIVCMDPSLNSPPIPDRVEGPTIPPIESPQARPMMIGGKPLPLPCLMSLRNTGPLRDNPIDLTKCSGGRFNNPGPVDISNGMIGFYDKSDRGYFYYTDLGQWNGAEVLWQVESDGASGAFSYLVSIDRDQNVLQPRDLAFGSNCSGGIVAAHVAEGHLTHDQAADAFDLVQWGDAIVFKHGDLDAAHCIARLHYRNEDFSGVSLTEKELVDNPDDLKRLPFQACFDSFYNQQVAKGKSEMSPGDFSAFKRQFMATCTIR